MKYILLWLGLLAVSFVLSLFAEDSPFRKNQKRSPRIIDDEWIFLTLMTKGDVIAENRRSTYEWLIS